jgi:serine O-acetyltransferase
MNQNVTIGGRGGNNPRGAPIIKDDVTIYIGAVILGNVTLKQGCTVGANSVVLKDVGERKTVVGSPASEV